MYSLIIPCAGEGKRVGLGYNKLLYKIANTTIIEKTLDAFISFQEFDEIILVINPKDEFFFSKIKNNDNRIRLIHGGKERIDSVLAGLQQAKNEIVFIHDGARCNISQRLIKKCLHTVKKNAKIAYGVGIKATDSVRCCENGAIRGVLNRDNIVLMQTPQIFKREILLDALNKKIRDTDEIGVMIQYGVEPLLIEGEQTNIKITSKKDLIDLELYESN